MVEARLGVAITDTHVKGIALDPHGRVVRIDGYPVPLTKTELDILSLFVDNPEKVFSREDLLSTIWPNDVIVTPRTVDVNITRIRKKIEPYSHCIVTRAGLGYSYTPAPEE